VGKIEDLVRRITTHPKDVRFTDLCKIYEHYFGEPRQSGSSHRIYKTPWHGDPRINIQSKKWKAKTYQVKQVLKAIERMGVKNGN
jgi:hypothetical protein